MFRKIIIPALLMILAFFMETIEANVAPNINEITSQELSRIAQIPVETAINIIKWRNEHDGFRSYLDLWKVSGMDVSTFNKVNSSTSLFVSRKSRSFFGQIERLHERLLDEDGPGNAAIDVWESYLVTPVNVHALSMDDLLQFQGISLIDAAVLSKTINERKEEGSRLSGYYTIRRLDNFSSSGYYGLRPFINMYDSKEKYAFHGDLRSELDFTTVDMVGDSYTKDEWISSLETAIDDIHTGYHNYEGSGIDTTRLKKRLEQELSILEKYKSQGIHSDRMRLFMGNNIIAGVALRHEQFADKFYNLYKGYASAQNYPYLHKLIVGDYRVTFGEGLIVDNTDEYRARSDFRTKGIFGDISNNRAFSFRGGAAEMRNDFASVTAFGSMQKRAAYENEDGTYSLMYNDYSIVPEEEKDAVKETVLGGHIAMNLGEISPLPWGTQLGFTILKTKYDKIFDPQESTFDIPNDSDFMDTKTFSTLMKGDKRTVIGGDFRTIIDFWGLSGEIARQSEGEGIAYLIKNYFQHRLGYLSIAKRRYDLAYDNPYNRGFSEHARFEDTMFEKDYRLNDPLMTLIQDYPTPKPEDGWYAETRMRLSRNIAITRAYMDLWTDLDTGGTGSRFQGEVEYKPVHPLRFRIRHKHQQRELPKTGNYSESVTDETTFSVFSPVSRQDFLAVATRYGRVKLMGTENTALREKMDGGFLNSYLNHRFNESLSLKLGITYWTTNGMSQWEFDERGIDFLDGRGYKTYLVLINKIGKNMDLKGFYAFKRSVYDHNNFMYRPDPQDELIEHPGFTDVRREHAFGFQLYLHW